MLAFLDGFKNNKYVIGAIKTVLSVCVLAAIGKALFIEGLKPFYSYKDYDYQNNFLEEQGEALTGKKQISQTFTAKGSILHNVSVYFGDITAEEIEVSISDDSGKVLAETVVRASEYSEHSWNQIGLNSTKLERNKKYIISFACEDGLGNLYCNHGDAAAILGDCFDKENQLEGSIAVDFKFTYKYLTLGSVFELVLKLIYSVIMGFALCYAVCKIEDVFKAFRDAGIKKGFSWALYFSVSLVLLYNPLEEIRNEVTEFSRVIGSGLAANVDVLKRVDNFTHWFIMFAIAFVLFFLLANYFLYKPKSKSAKRVEEFVNDFMVLANCSLVLRCITYFNDEAAAGSVYYFSAYAVMLVIFIAIAYIVLQYDKIISPDNFARLMMIGASLSLPIAIFVALEWDNGRVLLGVMAIMAVGIMVLCKLGRKRANKRYFSTILLAGVIILPLLPLMTSVYIELIHILNQYRIFVAHPAKYYKLAVMLVLIVFIVAAILLGKKNYKGIAWKKWAFPWLIVGMTCLSVQIPISSIHDPHIFEAANYSILISDFLNYGRIPIIEHYGGHMMASVWEGILYGLLNHDYAGAVVSPYSELFTPLIVVLFYYLVRKVWNEDMALFVTVLFPFLNSWTSFGLGMLVCMAAMFYVKKNSFFRAALVWAAFIWCVLYRLDLGVAFGVAVIAALLIYILMEKNWKAMKQLGLTLIGWGIAGGATWFIICFLKGINPVNRLLEFIMISLSNQNWAYAVIGTVENSIFSWSYLIIPFLIVICILYTIFSKCMRERIGKEKWVLLMVFGFCYFANFSRGLVRHGVIEGGNGIVIWCGYIFLAVFLSCYKDNKQLFLPVFMIIVLLNTLFIQNDNYSAVSIADGAVSKPADIIEGWKLNRFSKEQRQEKTYWEEIKCKKEVVERVKFSENLKDYMAGYEEVFNLLLDSEETFVDFINKTFIYSGIGKENPVYVSQSPLQLSGEFTQKEFIKEMKDVPIVLMPIDADGFSVSDTLDGITNTYRNYKVAEYIYQNYVPLCKNGSDYVIWCVKDRYEKYSSKLFGMVQDLDYLAKLKDLDEIGIYNVTLEKETDGSVTLVSRGENPMVYKLENIINLSPYYGMKMKLTIKYATDTSGMMQLFYTTDREEDYTEGKSVSVDVSGSGSAEFVIPISEYSHLRLDIPEGSVVNIKSLVASSVIEHIDYGYDGPMLDLDENGDTIYNYISNLHNHDINLLPRIWAEGDKEHSGNNSIIVNLSNEGGVYTFNPKSFKAGENGNYLKISAAYDGLDVVDNSEQTVGHGMDKLHDENDEQMEGTVILGSYNGNKFVEKCRYNMNFKEGEHDYLLRCSTDYYWYRSEINAVKIEAENALRNVKMQILEGD